MEDIMEKVLYGEPISSKSLRKERRLKTIKATLSWLASVLTIGTGVAVGVGMLWIIQVGVMSI